MLCSKCDHELTEEMFLNEVCFNCGAPVSESKRIHEAEQARKAIEAEEQRKALIQHEKELLTVEKQNRYNNHLLTTGFSFETFHIVKYIGLVSGEIVIGTGYFSNLEASFSDIFGVQSTEYSDKIKKAKTLALDDMIAESTEKGGNAIIGVSYDIITFNRDMIGVSVNGTSVIVGPAQ